MLFHQRTLILLITLLTVATTTMTHAAEHALEPVVGGLHRIQSDGQTAGIVYFGDTQALASDIASPATAEWLQQELRSRELSLRYLVLSSPTTQQIDAVRSVLETGATLVGHDSASELLLSMASGPITFTTDTTLWIDAQPVKLHHPGESVTEHQIFLHWPQLEAVYAGNLVAVESIPAELPEGTDLAAWVRGIDRMNRIDFTYLLSAQGHIGIQQDGREFGWFLRTLANDVRHATKVGLTEEETLDQLTFESYYRWQGWKDNLKGLVASVYQTVRQ